MDQRLLKQKKVYTYPRDIEELGGVNKHVFCYTNGSIKYATRYTGNDANEFNIKCDISALSALIGMQTRYWVGGCGDTCCQPFGHSLTYG